MQQSLEGSLSSGNLVGWSDRHHGQWQDGRVIRTLGRGEPKDCPALKDMGGGWNGQDKDHIHP
jgi:hypothetical protein